MDREEGDTLESILAVHNQHCLLPPECVSPLYRMKQKNEQFNIDRASL